MFSLKISAIFSVVVFVCLEPGRWL